MILFFCFSNTLKVIVSRKPCLFTQWISTYNSLCSHCHRTLLIDDLFNDKLLFIDKNIMEHYRYFRHKDNLNMEQYFNAKRRFLKLYSQSRRERTWINIIRWSSHCRSSLQSWKILPLCLFTSWVSPDISRCAHCSRLFCDKMLIDLLVCFRNGAYFSNELRFELEAEMNGVYDTLW